MIGSKVTSSWHSKRDIVLRNNAPAVMYIPRELSNVISSNGPCSEPSRSGPLLQGSQNVILRVSYIRLHLWS